MRGEVRARWSVGVRFSPSSVDPRRLPLFGLLLLIEIARLALLTWSRRLMVLGAISTDMFVRCSTLVSNVYLSRAKYWGLTDQRR